MENEDTPVSWTSLCLLERYRAGDDRAADDLFERYFERLTSLARSLLSARLARRTDPEDVVLSAYRSFFVAARGGRFTLQRGGDLWRLLAAMTRHKLLRHVRHETADRRSIHAEVPLDFATDGPYPPAVQEPTPAEVVALADEVEWLLARLTDFGRRVVELRLQGAELSTIADDTGRSERTVRRSLAEVRQLLARRFDNG